MFGGVSFRYSAKRVLGLAFIILASSLFVCGLMLHLPLYYLSGPVVNSVCFIVSSVFLVSGLFLYFDVFVNETADGKKALFLLGLSFILFVAGIVSATYYYVYYDWDYAELRTIPGEGPTREKVLFVPAVNVYPFSGLSPYLFLVSAVLFVSGLIAKFKSSHAF